MASPHIDTFSRRTGSYPRRTRHVLAILAHRRPPELDDNAPDIRADRWKWGTVMQRSVEVTGSSRYLGGEKKLL